MPTALSPEVKQLVDRANFAHLATLMPDGSPQSVPVWIGQEGEHLVICTGETSLKGKNTRRDRESHCRSSTSRILTKKSRSAAALSNAAPIST
jgi:nitroimidazol reductase NimA-like FMN-containing flavoprotein (pyridoxamine 5'-phosphate oxidase superfamily)